MPSVMEQALAGSGSSNTAPKKKGVSQSVFDEVKEQLTRKNNKLRTMAENGRAAGTTLINVAETTGTTFLVSMAKGAWGDEKLKLGKKVSIPTAAGLGLVAWGLYDVLNGKDGSHQVHIGLGAIGSDAADLGREAGAKMREAWDKKDGAAAGSGSTTTTTQAADSKAPPAAKLSGPLRELETGRDDFEGRGGGGSGSGSRDHAIVPVRVLRLTEYDGY